MPIDFEPLSRQDARAGQSAFDAPEQPPISIFELYWDELKANYEKPAAASELHDLNTVFAERAKERDLDNGRDPYANIGESNTLPPLEIHQAGKK